MNAAPLSLAIPVPVYHKPIVTQVVRPAGSWIPKWPAPSVRAPSVTKTTVVTCENCGSVMNTERLTYSVFQVCCPSCGTSGPRKSSVELAIAAVLRIFPPPLPNETKTITSGNQSSRQLPPLDQQPMAPRQSPVLLPCPS